LDAGIETLDVLVLVATMTDALTRRLGELAIAELGEPPVPWAWLALGSEARREQTPATDQDNALAYDGDAPELDGFFAALAERMNRWLAYCGHPECRAGVMARNRGWRLPRSAWIELFESWLRDPTRHAVEIAMIASDFRTVTGPLSIGRDLDPILEEAVHHPLFLERLASAAVELRPPTGFLREFVVERSGEHAGTLDIKDGGVLPIVNLARFHALSAGSSAKPTLDRLHAAAAAGSITTESAAQLEEAFVTVGRVRIEHQAAQLERGVQADNHIAPRDLPPSTRSELKRAFRAIARAQRRVETHVATRIP
jgi:CBS domain-containing protein